VVGHRGRLPRRCLPRASSLMAQLQLEAVADGAEVGEIQALRGRVLLRNISGGQCPEHASVCHGQGSTQGSRVSMGNHGIPLSGKASASLKGELCQDIALQWIHRVCWWPASA